MRTVGAVVFAAITLGMASHSLARTEPAVEELPVVGRIFDLGPTKIVVRGQLSRDRARKMLQLARSVYRHAVDHYVPGKEDLERDPVQLCLFERARDYDRFVTRVFGPGDHSGWGFYRGDLRIVVINLEASTGNLRHELIHPLVHDSYDDAPAWVNEGLGSLYGSSSPRGRRGFRFRVNYRLRAPQQALLEGTLPTFRQLAHSGRDELYGPRSAVYYGMSRYVLLYLERHDKLETFFSRMRSSDGRAASHLRILESLVEYPEFIRWLRTLRYGRRTKNRSTPNRT